MQICSFLVSPYTAINASYCQMQLVLCEAEGVIVGVIMCRVCEEMLRCHLYPPTSESLALMCGPPGMQDASIVHLEKWGYKKEEVIIF